MTDVRRRAALDRRGRAGALGDFLLSQAAWEAYYGPLAARVEAVGGGAGATHPVLAEHLEEIAVWRAHGADYGYAFFVAG